MQECSKTVDGIGSFSGSHWKLVSSDDPKVRSQSSRMGPLASRFGETVPGGEVSVC